jgi:Ca-activated chloride channel family protein
LKIDYWLLVFFNQGGHVLKKLILAACFACLIAISAFAEENPDELYKQGKFAEAEASYARFDMDNPKDIRYRYNRGCAAYQNSDYQGAAAAFSSALRRSKDKDVLFRSSFNLGNTAFKKGDFASAAAFYKQAVSHNPEDRNAPYNLELALRELEKQKQKEAEQKEKSPDTCPAPQENQNQQPQSGEGKKSPDQKKSEEDSQQNEDQNRDRSSQQSADKEQQDQPDSDRSEKQKEDEPQDLAGELTPRDAPSGEERAEGPQPQTQAMMDKNRAEALLDNIKEDRQRFMQFQIPEDKKDGVSSGRGW